MLVPFQGHIGSAPPCHGTGRLKVSHGPDEYIDEATWPACAAVDAHVF